MYTHHVVPVKNGGTDREENLVHLHICCHQHFTSG
ncbi:HNH endonuclease [Microcoleus sp. F4-D5]